jgi:hypothetical protein
MRSGANGLDGGEFAMSRARELRPRRRRFRRLAAFTLTFLLLSPNAFAGRVGDFRETSWYWALESQRRMAMDEPISNVMRIHGHNSYNTLESDHFHILPVAGPNQVLSIKEQLDIGSRVVELDVHDLINLEFEICPLDTGLDIGINLTDLVAENLGIDLGFLSASATPLPASETSFETSSFFGFLGGIFDIIDEIGGFFKKHLKDAFTVVTESLTIFAGLAAGDLTPLIKVIVDELNLVAEFNLCRTVTGFCFPPKPVPGLPQTCFSPAGVPGVGALFVGHAQGAAVVPVNGTQPYGEAMAQIGSWLRANPREIVIIDLEDRTGGRPDNLLAEVFDEFVDSDGNSLLFTPVLRDDLFEGRWPTRRELLAVNKRVLVMDSQDESFDPYTWYESPTGHEWRGSDFVFRRSSIDDVLSGNWLERKVDDYAPGNDPGERENVEQFFAVLGDGLVNGAKGAAPVSRQDVELMARNNVNVLKMDFLVGAGADNLVGWEGPGGVPGFNLPEGEPGERLGGAVWSWADDDPAPFRLRGDEDAFEGNRDFAVQQIGGSRWLSANFQGRSVEVPPEDAVDHRYACMSLDRDANGEPEWRVTAARGPWTLGNEHCRAEFGRYVYAAPVNGRRNSRLRSARIAAGVLDEPVWLDVFDEQRNGEYVVNLAPAAILRSSGGRVNEGMRLVGLEEPPPDPGDPAQVPKLGVQRLVFPDSFGAVSVESISEDGDVHRDAMAHFWDWSYDDPKGQGLPSGGNIFAGESFGPFPDDGTTTFSLFVTDGHLAGFDSSSVEVTVSNVAPSGGIEGIVDEGGASIPGDVPFALVGIEVTITAGFSDPGIFDTHTATFEWGDGESTDQADFDAFSDTVQGEGGAATARHVFAASGDYEVELIVLDDDGDAGRARGAIRVATADEAVGFAAEDLVEIAADPALDEDARALLLEAIDWLEGRQDGLAANGSADRLAVGGSPNAGLIALGRALSRLAEAAALDPSLAGSRDFGRARRLLALAGKSVVAQVLGTLETDRGDAARRSAEAEAFVAVGDSLRDAGDYEGANTRYLLASRLVQGLATVE